MDSSINWSSRIAQFSPEISKIPPDITFKFLGEDDVGTGVRAHKMILAMASEVFMKMFYEVNTADMSAKEIVIEDTTAPAFRIMVDAIYGFKTIKESLKGKSPHEMFVVLSLVKKYMIPELVVAVKECISSFPLTKDSVLEVAHEAVEFSSSFSDASESLLLLLACVNFIETEIKDTNSFLQVVAANGDRMSTVHKLAVLMKEKPPCSNCNTNPCQNVVVVKAAQFREGLKITINPASDSWQPTVRNWNGEVVKVLSHNFVKVKRKCNFMDNFDDIAMNSGTNDYEISWEGELRLLFSCEKV